MSGDYRDCAGAIVFNRKGEVLLGNRIDTDEDAWQFPQGGIERGETPLEAALRELFEEMSVESVKPVAVDDKPYRYDFPKEICSRFEKRGIKSLGQDIYFSLLYYCGKESEINVQTASPEFSEYKWDSFDFAVQQIVSFKKDIYVSAYQRFIPLIKQYINEHS